MDYLIQTTDLHALKITRSVGANTLIYISTNHRTFGLDEAMARQLVLGLRAVLDGGFTRAISEIAFELELREQEFRARRMQAPHHEPSRSERPSEPRLENL